MSVYRPVTEPSALWMAINEKFLSPGRKSASCPPTETRCWTPLPGESMTDDFGPVDGCSEQATANSASVTSVMRNVFMVPSPKRRTELPQSVRPRQGQDDFANIRVQPQKAMLRRRNTRRTWTRGTGISIAVGRTRVAIANRASLDSAVQLLILRVSCGARRCDSHARFPSHHPPCLVRSCSVGLCGRALS